MLNEFESIVYNLCYSSNGFFIIINIVSTNDPFKYTNWGSVMIIRTKFGSPLMIYPAKPIQRYCTYQLCNDD